jgi:cytochrome c oxidase subunit II
MFERSRRTGFHPITGAAMAALTLTACGGEMSTLNPAGQAAADIAWISVVMFIGMLVLMALMSGLWLHAVYRRPEKTPPTSSNAALIGGGLALPLIVITLLLVYGVRSGQSMLPIGSADLEIQVTAHQWFWEFEYETPNGQTILLIDELHLPKDRRIDFHITTADVIHGFWIPALGGKIDAIPGRVNTLRLVPTRAGDFGGQCAEFCGARHAHMRFEVVVHEPADFERWLAEAGQASP